MRRRLRRSKRAAKPSSANGGSSIAPSPTAWRRQETACSPSRACRRANGAAYAPPTRSSVCTRNSSAGSRPKPFCRRPTPLQCCSGRCSPQDRSTCARWMVGRRSPQSPSISRLTFPPETIPSCSRRMRHTNSNRISDGTAPGADGLTWADYAADLDRNLTDLHARVHSGAYRALPSRRKYIPKADGKQRPLGIAALEDKIVQAAVVAILTPIYEAEFLGFNYGFRPGRGQHDALDALAYGINARKINWILDADISRFFDTLSREWLIRLVEHRIGDRRIIRLIQKWLKAGVLEDGRLIETTEGTPQGSVASPLLANVYLHYVYDLWVEQWRTRHARGDMIVVRYADDTIVGFQHQQDAERFLIDLKERLAKFALSLHPEKTRLLEFGRYAAGRRAERGQGKPETNFAKRSLRSIWKR